MRLIDGKWTHKVKTLPKDIKAILFGNQICFNCRGAAGGGDFHKSHNCPLGSSSGSGGPNYTKPQIGQKRPERSDGGKMSSHKKQHTQALVMPRQPTLPLAGEAKQRNVRFAK